MEEQNNEFLSKECLTFYFFIRKLPREVIYIIEDILGIPKFKKGDFFLNSIPISTSMGRINLNRTCQVYHIDKIVRNFKQEVPKDKIRMNNYKYYYINRLSGRIGYIIDEDKMIYVEDKEIKNPNKIKNNNLWI